MGVMTTNGFVLRIAPSGGDRVSEALIVTRDARKSAVLPPNTRAIHSYLTTIAIRH